MLGNKSHSSPQKKFTMKAKLIVKVIYFYYLNDMKTCTQKGSSKGLPLTLNYAIILWIYVITQLCSTRNINFTYRHMVFLSYSPLIVPDFVHDKYIKRYSFGDIQYTAKSYSTVQHCIHPISIQSKLSHSYRQCQPILCLTLVPWARLNCKVLRESARLLDKS